MAFGNETCREKQDKVCPYCSMQMYVNPRTFANHVRHCKQNPDYDKLRESTRKTLKEVAVRKRFERVGSLQEFHVNCFCCGKEFTVFEEEKLFPKKKKYFCSRSCSNVRIRTEETKSKIRESLRKRNRDKLEIRVCPVCEREFEVSSKCARVCCSRECSRRFKARNLFKFRDLFFRYRKCCQFRFSLKDLAEIEGIELLEKFGMYKAANRGNNLKGVSRDHKFSIREAFNQKIDPYLISHPANCRLLQQQDNEKKGTKCSISLKELKQNVDSWNCEHGKYENRVDYQLISDLDMDRFKL